jgi:protein arginine kinase
MADLSSLIRNARWFSTTDEDTDVAISSRVRLARNLADFSYPGLTPGLDRDQHDAEAATELIGDTVRAELMPDVFGAESLEVQPLKLEPAVSQLLMERRLVDEPLPQRLFVTSDESAALSVGAVDHLRISTLHHGIHIDSALAAARTIDKKLESNLNYAVSLDLGYLSTSITNLGTALRASVLVHLPGLSRLGRIDEIQQSIRASDFDLAPDDQFTADDGESAIFRLSNRRSLGFEEDALATKLEDHARALVHYERVAREELVATTPSELADAAYRAYGVLRYARHLGADETLTLLSTLRLGVVADMVDDVAAATVTALFFLSRDSHVRAMMHQAGTPDGDGEENLQLARARLIREALAN